MDKNKYLIELCGSKRTCYGKVDFAEQSEQQKVFSAIWALESDVNNGGFAQWIENDQGESAFFAPTALKKIGATKCAKIVEDALRTAGQGVLPSDSATLVNAINRMGDKTREELHAFDPGFYAYPDNLTDLLFEFVRGHPTVFGPIEE